MNTPLKRHKTHLADTTDSFSPGNANPAKLMSSTQNIEPDRKLVPALIVFFTTVFASLAAAATVVSNDIPLMMVGL